MPFMTGVRQWRRSRVLVASAVVAAGAGGVWAYQASQPQPPQRPLPAATASLHEVATAYLDAAVQQDCEMTRALTVPGDAFAWCTSPTMTAYRDLTGPTVPTAEQAGGQEEQCLSFEMTGSDAGARSLQSAVRPWSLCFVRTPAGWRVANQGQG